MKNPTAQTAYDLALAMGRLQTFHLKRVAEQRGAHPRPAIEGSIEGDTTTCPHCETEQPARWQRYCESCGLLMSDGAPSVGGDE